MNTLAATALYAAWGRAGAVRAPQDVYARRIDRFFRWHPELSDDQLTHGYFEVRAVAARRASVFRLMALIHDPDETVPVPLLPGLCRDADEEIRQAVRERLPNDMTPTGASHGRH